MKGGDKRAIQIKAFRPWHYFSRCFAFCAAVVLIWWPTDVYFMGISLAGWLMFSSYAVWFLLAVIYVVWTEKREKAKMINEMEGSRYANTRNHHIRGIPYLNDADGHLFHKRAHSSENDYWTAGKSINTFVGAFALFAALASSSSLMGAVGSGVALGVPFLFAYGFGAVAILPFTLFLVSGQIRRSGVSTLPEFFKQRYGKAVQIVAVFIVVFGMTFYMVPQLTASGLIGSYVLGVDYKTAVIVLGIGFTLYAALGGMWAITYTDLIQGSVMLIGMLVLSLIILVQHNGFSSLIQDALATSPNSVTSHSLGCLILVCF